MDFLTHLILHSNSWDKHSLWPDCNGYEIMCFITCNRCIWPKNFILLASTNPKKNLIHARKYFCENMPIIEYYFKWKCNIWPFKSRNVIEINISFKINAISILLLLFYNKEFYSNAVPAISTNWNVFFLQSKRSL